MIHSARFILSISVCLLLLVLQSTSTYAQESEIDSAENNQPNSSEPSSENEVEPYNENTAVQNSSNRNFDVFLPSEDISEDLAVPFPVDI